MVYSMGRASQTVFSMDIGMGEHGLKHELLGHANTSEAWSLGKHNRMTGPLAVRRRSDFEPFR